MKNCRFGRSRPASLSCALVHVIASGMGLFVSGEAAWAQSLPVTGEKATVTMPPPAENTGGDIIVTARRREETLLSVPVTVSAVSGAQLNARGVNDLEGLARTIPQLILSPSNGGFQGGAMSLRGIGAGDGNTFGDQAVGFYIDGVMVARSTPVKMGQLDLQQVEVLKGPQALYYGKNSPGGVVVLRSADPTDHFEAGGQIGYEFNAHEVRGEGYISTPLTDSLGMRIAVGGSTMRGWLKNIATPNPVYSPTDRYLPQSREFETRFTLKFDDGGPFKGRFKFTYGQLRDAGFNATGELVSCPLGRPQAGGTGPSDCKADGNTVYTNAGPRFGTGGVNTVTGAAIAGNPYFGDGVPYSSTKQYLAGLELSYALNDHLTLSSTTGLYDAKVNVLHVLITDSTFAYNPANPAGAQGAIPAAIGLKIREISEEGRLTSSFDGPINFMVGGYFQDQRLSQPISASVNALNPIALFPPFFAKQHGTSYSGFVSVSYKPTDTIELSGGARYSHERKSASFFRLLPGVLPASQGGAAYIAGTQIPTTVPERSFHNVSPEVTLTWRPTSRFTAYGSWKRGFISGGFNPGGGGTAVALLPDRSYDQEIVEGFETGVKGLFLDGALRTNLALYTYKIKGLQSSRIDPATSAQTISNAASARTKGIEFDATWKTPLKGFSVNTAVAYDHARYLRYDNGPCYGGQSIAAGCDLGLNPAGTVYTQQDLSGKPLVRAPDWGIALGGSYETKDAAGNTIGISVNGNYTSKIYTDPANAPGGLQKGYWLLDATLRYAMSNGIELALIGRNLTNTYYFQRSADETLTGGGTGTANAFRSDTMAGISRPREVMIRLGYKFR